MAQVKIFGTQENFIINRQKISDAIHESLISVFKLPQEKRFQRFFTLETADFVYPSDRTSHYTIIELIIFEGRSKEIKKQLIKSIISLIHSKTNIHVNDIEITIIETPLENWGIRGQNGDELSLSYKVNQGN